MRGTEFGELTAFVAVAEQGNFSKAAATLGISTSTMSQTIRSLEERLGVRLLNRTTRSVALTEAGETLLRQVHPALDELGQALDSISAARDTPAGTLRLTIGSIAVRMVIDPILSGFRAAYPDVTLDIVVDDALVDIVDGHFDAGIRSGSRIERDMIAMRVSPDSRWIAVAAPAYLAAHGAPATPQDLREHDAIRFRQTTGLELPWVFERQGEKVEVKVGGSLITNDVDFGLRAARDGAGIAYMVEAYVRNDVKAGRLVPVLEEWSLPVVGFHLFYASRRQMPAKLKALIDYLRQANRTALPRPRLVPPLRAESAKVPAALSA